MNAIYFSFIFFALLIIVNLLIVIPLFKREDIAYSQKVYQSIIVFAIPFIGASIIWAFHRGEDTPISENKKTDASSGFDSYTSGGTGID
jgi:hypothetical protein